MSISSPDTVLLSFGTYNPPTPIHFRIFEIAKDHFEQINKSRVIAGIVVLINEGSEIVSIEHRNSMVKLSLQSSDWIKLSDRTCQAQELYAIRNLLQYHHNVIKDATSGPEVTDQICLPIWLPRGIQPKEKVQVKLLGGVDMFENYFNLKNKQRENELEQILNDHGLVIVSKSGMSCEKIVFDSDLLAKYKGSITLLTNWASSEVTSTLVRRLISRKQSVKYLLDDSVIDYIRDNNLYTHYDDSNIEHKLPETLPALKIKETSSTEEQSRDKSSTSTSGEMPSSMDSESKEKSRKHQIDYNGDLSKFLKFAIETKRIKAVRKEQYFV